MAYGDFDLKDAVQTFGLIEEPDADLYAAIEPSEPSECLRDVLAEFAPIAIGINTEQARREYIIAPMLIETKRRVAVTGVPFNVLPGVTFDVDKARGLTGYCDYLLTRSTTIHYVKGPLFAVVEAKREDMAGGLGQCVAELVAIRLFNDREGTPLPVVHGCVTSGNLWRFLKLAGDALTIDRVEYHLHDAAKILGILVHIVRS